MPSKAKKIDRDVAKLPSIPKELVELFLTGPMTGEAINDAGLAFKKALIEASLKAELSHHLGHESGSEKPDQAPNHRNGGTAKTVLTGDGQGRIETPRDRAGSFEPLLLPKHARRFTAFDDKIIALYARGLTVREIQGYLVESYGIDVSPDFISTVTDGVLTEVTTWQARPLEPVYPVVFFDKTSAGWFNCGPICATRVGQVERSSSSRCSVRRTLPGQFQADRGPANTRRLFSIFSVSHCRSGPSARMGVSSKLAPCQSPCHGAKHTAQETAAYDGGCPNPETPKKRAFWAVSQAGGLPAMNASSLITFTSTWTRVPDAIPRRTSSAEPLRLSVESNCLHPAVLFPVMPIHPTQWRHSCPHAMLGSGGRQRFMIFTEVAWRRPLTNPRPGIQPCFSSLASTGVSPSFAMAAS
jgi:hypothetical protein